MMTMTKIRFARLAGVALIAGSVLLAGCDVDDLLNVEDPDTVTPGTLDDPAVLSTVVAGARSEFVNAYSSGESYVSVTALLSDEYRAAGTFSTRNATDRRDQQTIQQGNTSDGTYINLHQARFALGDAAVRVEGFEGTSDPRFAELKALEAMTLVMLGEAYCSSAPVSTALPDGTSEFGSPQSSAQTLNDAIAIADEAGGGNLAAIVKGRALLNLGQASDAAAAVASVPTDFVYYAQHSVEGNQNGVWTLGDQRRYSIPEAEGQNGLPFRSVGTQFDADQTTVLVPGDPRQPWFLDARGGFEDGRDAASTLRYVARDAELPVGTGIEARLIEAEAAMMSSPGEMMSILNDLRAGVVANLAILAPGYTPEPGASLAPLTDPGTADGRRDLLFRERGLWLFMTGHRLGDLRRLVAHYGLPVNEVYPMGVYYKDDGSGTDVYAGDVVFPVEFDEGNNPNYDLALCDVGSASFEN